MTNNAIANGNLNDRPGSGSQQVTLPQPAVHPVRTGLHGKARIVGRLMTVLVMAAGLGVVVAQPASAAPRVGVLRNWATGNCLDGDGAGKIYVRRCSNNNAYQQWEITIYQSGGGGDLATFRSKGTGLYLNGWHGFPSGEGLNAGSYWRGLGPDWSHVMLQIDEIDKTCLDSDFGVNAYMTPCMAGNGHQLWNFGSGF
jgi:hypothetical protein